MTGENDLDKLLKTMRPSIQKGDYVFCTINDLKQIEMDELVFFFKEQEGYTIILKKEKADRLRLAYSFVASWITLKVHSSLEAVGLTAAFSKALAAENIPCNVVAGYFHDHLFVRKGDRNSALKVLNNLL